MGMLCDRSETPATKLAELEGQMDTSATRDQHPALGDERYHQKTGKKQGFINVTNVI